MGLLSNHDVARLASHQRGCPERFARRLSEAIDAKPYAERASIPLPKWHPIKAAPVFSVNFLESDNYALTGNVDSVMLWS